MVLAHRGFGAPFIAWINSLYGNPRQWWNISAMKLPCLLFQAAHSSGVPFLFFCLYCLFVLTLETLARHVHLNVNILRIRLAGIPHKLFANDIWLSHTFLLNLISLLQGFASLSGLHVNQPKSQALNVSLKETVYDFIHTQFPFQ